jgi:hypothetical protein
MPQKDQEFIGDWAKLLFHKYGLGVIDFADAAAELGYKTTKAAYTALARKAFPVRVEAQGRRKKVLLSNLAHFLATGESQAPRVVTRGPGRPSNAERLARVHSV